MKSHKERSDDTRIALLEQSINHINETMLRMEKRFDSIDKKFESLNNNINNRFDMVNNRLWTNFFWMLGGFIGVLGMIAHIQHWIY